MPFKHVQGKGNYVGTVAMSATCYCYVAGHLAASLSPSGRCWHSSVQPGEESPISFFGELTLSDLDIYDPCQLQLDGIWT